MQTVVLYPLYQSITFWICVGLFLYFTGNFFFLLLIKSTSDVDIKLQMKIFYSFVTITKNVFLSLAFFATEKIDEEDILHIPSELDLDSFNPKTTLN